MKKYLLLPLLVLGSLTSCQQEDIAEVTASNEIGFEASIEGVTTRSGANLDIISLCAEYDKAFSSFNLKMEKHNWKNHEKNEIDFYAHYPLLSEDLQLDTERFVKGGENYFFAKVTAKHNDKKVSLKFKHMTVPVAVYVMDENGNEQKPKSVRASIKNKGLQNMKTGTISTNRISEVENTELIATSSEEFTYLLPQTIKEGTIFEVRLNDNTQATARLSKTVQLSNSNTYKFVIDKGNLDISIFDPVIPL